MKAKQDAPNYLVYLGMTKIDVDDNDAWSKDSHIALASRALFLDWKNGQLQCETRCHQYLNYLV
ncbi:hypothetical protein ACMAZF_14585 [Psychrobium sp. nBUS_13]|uniref:hypothetical protein n=1 Tax=Psychrobium sp. nBUS_13 TaxID=3395319 RepID=UPI003EBF18C7